VSGPVLVVDDEAESRQAIALMLQANGIGPVEPCEDPRRVLALVVERAFDCVLLDLTMPHLNGEELLVRLQAEHPALPVVVVTGSDVVDTAVRCMRQGAIDYLTKPVDEGRLVTCVRRILELRELDRINASLKEAMLAGEAEAGEAFRGIVTASPLLRGIFRYVAAIAPTAQPVLITGETGTGKELLARAVHRASGRTGGFVAVNIAGLDDQLFSDTLFGHRRGAFTGADAVRKGLIESAAGGTLFLDEIGELSGPSQVKLLRLLQEREYFPLGSDVPRRSDCRVVCATHADLGALQAADRFRRDLFFRLRAHHVEIPPLRRRPEDLPLLVQRFVARAAADLGRPEPVVPPGLLALLGAYHFPGNVRELEAMVFDAVGRHRGGVLALDRFREVVGPGPVVAAGSTLPAGDRPAVVFGSQLPDLKTLGGLLVDEALRRTGGNQAAAAALLGISRQALNQRLRSRDRS
jgi:DNA-binding NtrC family response regulator